MLNMQGLQPAGSPRQAVRQPPRLMEGKALRGGRTAEQSPCPSAEGRRVRACAGMCGTQPTWMTSPSARSDSRKSLALRALPSCMPFLGPAPALGFSDAESGLREA